MAKILLVDDVELFLELERSYLENSGHQVITATSGQEALDRLTQERPQAVLLDLYMPGMDGIEVCRRIRGQKPFKDLPIIMVTAAGKEEEIRRCLEAGCDDYVTKPVNKKDLLEKLHQVLGLVKSRTAPRTPVSLRVDVQASGKDIVTYTRDLSRQGIFLRSGKVLEVGTPVVLKLELAGGRTAEVPGKVKRVQAGENGGMGVYFIHPAPEAQKVLEGLMNGGSDAPAKAAPAADSLRTEMTLMKRRLAELEEENGSLIQRIEELEEENRRFAGQIVQIEDLNNNLTNLYIASSRLHSILDRVKVAEIIKEVVINFVGAEKFAILLLDKERRHLAFETGEGFDERSFPAVSLNEGVLGQVMTGGQSYFREGSVVEGSDDPLAPLAAIPLNIQGRLMGILAVYRLFIQKERFEPIDYQLFSMLAEHAATALFSSSLYEVSERKRETYKGFMDLLLQ